MHHTRPFYILFAKPKINLTWPKVLQTPKELKEDTTDNYKKVHSVETRVIGGNYCEVLRKEANQTYYFVDNTKTCFISEYCIVGICPDLPYCDHKRKGEKINKSIVINEVSLGQTV